MLVAGGLILRITFLGYNSCFAIITTMDIPVKTFTVPNELCRRAGVAGTWLPINNIGIFPNQQPKWSSRDAASSFASSTPASVFQVRQEVVLFHPILRKLINEASGIFVNVQMSVGGNPSDLKTDLLQCSVQYRSIIRACLESLRDEVMRTEGSQKEEMQNYVTIFYSVECIWHLCEILYISNIPGYVVIKYLMEWIRFHFPKYELKAGNLLRGDLMGIESHPDYWETVVGSLMQGRIEVTRALLSLHSFSQSPAFKLADQALKTMPVYDIYEGVSMNEFSMRWKHWLVDTQSKIDAKLFVSENKVDLIMRLIVGEEFAWAEVQEACEAWYEYMAAWLYFTEPTVKSFELGRFARKCIAQMDITMHHLDRVLLAAMEGDVEVIKEIQHMTDNGWFVTHLVDLLFHSGQLEKWQAREVSASKLRESFLVEYGTLLMGHRSTWQIGLNYLDHSPNDGIGSIMLLLPRIAINSEADANKVIREAQKRDLLSIVYSISKIEGVKCLQKGRIGNALIWALKSQDANFVSFLADNFLNSYLQTGILLNTDLFHNVGLCMMASDRLIFLGKYYEYQRLFRENNFREAAGVLISLVSSKFTPSYFWCTLLSDAVELLDGNELVLTANDTLILLDCLCERVNMPGMKERVPIMRKAIARNLARASIHEAQFI